MDKPKLDNKTALVIMAYMARMVRKTFRGASAEVVGDIVMEAFAACLPKLAPVVDDDSRASAQAYLVQAAANGARSAMAHNGVIGRTMSRKPVSVTDSDTEFGSDDASTSRGILAVTTVTPETQTDAARTLARVLTIVDAMPGPDRDLYHAMRSTEYCYTDQDTFDVARYAADNGLTRGQVDVRKNRLLNSLRTALAA